MVHEHPVGVEDRGIDHLPAILRGRGLHSHPAEAGNALTDGAQVVEKGRGSLAVAELDDGFNLLARSLEDLEGMLRNLRGGR